MIKTGITGNIACGKSTAFEIIKESGYPVIDCDDIVKDLYNDSFFVTETKKTFSAIIKDNQIDKNLLSKLLFSDNNFKSDFENFIFPKVKEKILEFFEITQLSEQTRQSANKNIIFVIAPLLFEAGFEEMFDKIIFISANENIRKERLIKRNSLLSSKAETVIKSQISEEEKIPRCDYVIKNNGTLEEFRNAVLKLAVN